MTATDSAANDARIGILGGGASGLAAAHALRELGTATSSIARPPFNRSP
jgi:hypothetical protein